MIILDTNVISEVMRGQQADAGVIHWLRALPEEPVTTVVNRAEIMAWRDCSYFRTAPGASV